MKNIILIGILVLLLSGCDTMYSKDSGGQFGGAGAEGEWNVSSNLKEIDNNFRQLKDIRGEIK